MKTTKKTSSGLRFEILTIFPDIFDSYFKESLVARAVKEGVISINVHNLRDYAEDKHKKVDDRPFGGGPGMVLKVDPIYRAIRAIKKKLPLRKKVRTVLFSTRGKPLNSKSAKRLSGYDAVIFICGRYEGVDERVAQKIADEELSIGDYVLSGGELAAMVSLEAISRFKPGFLGKFESLEDIKGSYPSYTRPAVFEPKKGKKRLKWEVPKALLSGNHKEIESWRRGK